MTLSLDSHVDCYVDLCQGASLPRLELEDDWISVWKEVSVCYPAVDPVKLIVAVGPLLVRAIVKVM